MFINTLSVILLSVIPIQSFTNVNSATDAVFTKHEKVALEASGMIATSNGFGTGTCFEYKNRKIILTAKHVIKENADNNEKIYFLQNNKTIESSITNKKTQIRNQTLLQDEASSHKKPDGSPEIGTVCLSRGLGVPRVVTCGTTRVLGLPGILAVQ